MYSAHSQLLSWSPVLFALVVGVAIVLRARWSGFSLGYFVAAVWGWIILASYLAATIRVSTMTWGALILVPLAGLCIFSLRTSYQGRAVLEVTSRTEVMTFYATWLAGMIVISTPLMFLLPDNTMISGRHICNDVLGHAIVAMGLQFYERVGLDTSLFHWYPKGFHSTLGYIAALLNRDTAEVILPFLLLSYSLMVAVAWELGSSLGIRSHLHLFGLALLACAPFFNLVVLYTGFAAQAAAIPFILIGLVRIFSARVTSLDQHLSAIMFTALVSIALYSLFPVTILGLGVMIKFALDGAPLRSWWDSFKSILTVRTGLFVMGLLLLAYPALSQMALLVSRQLSGDSLATDVLKSPGNLSGYLSPLHLAGFWDPTIDYRLRSGRSQTWLEYVQLAAIAGYLWALFALAVPSALRGMLLTAVVPVVAIPILGLTEYLHFKYLALLTPILILSVGATLVRSIERYRFLMNALFICLVSGLLYASLGYSSRVIAAWPIISRNEYRSYAKFRDRHLTRGEVVVLSQDDWLRYFVVRSDVYLPLIGTLPTYYRGEPLKRIVVDKQHSGANFLFFQQFPELEPVVKSEKCRIASNSRFDVFSVPCLER